MNKGKKLKLGTFIVLGFFVYFVYTMITQQNMIYLKNRELSSMQEKINRVQHENDKLKKQKKILNTDEYYEKIAREKLGMVKPGEKVFFDINK